MKLRILFLLLFGISVSYAQTLTIGITGSNPPFSSRIDQHNHFYGIDIEIMSEVCRRMSVQCQYAAMRFDDLAPAIDQNKIVLAIDSIIITPDRQEKYLFSQPYLTSRVRFLTNKTSDINSLNDLKGKRIGVRQRAQFNELFIKLNQEKMTVKVYSHMTSVLEGLANDEVDAIVINNISAQYWYANNDQYKLIGEAIPLGNGFGIMAKLGNQALITKVNHALEQMMADGTYMKIYHFYF